jgi:hypothetical protein|tara:strand:+ start:621 stop:1127 length:507 start_codon:yes stop_codon:yes gene_type:complete
MVMNKKKGEKNLFLELIKQLELKRKPKNKLKEKVEKRKNKKKVNELSDTVEDVKINFKDSKKEKILYSMILEKVKSLDYTKLEYGKIAEPLAINWGYENYQKEGSNNNFSSEETISTEDINRIIEEDVINEKCHISTTNISVDARERFKYFKLFNKTLVENKYEMAFN